MKKAVRTLLVISIGILFFSCGIRTQEKEQIMGNSDMVKAENSPLTAIEELSASPRHHEWVTLSHGDREFQAFVVYPENDKPSKSIVVIHENRGLNDWARLFADKLAARGYLVIAPDMISNTQGKKRTTDFDNPDAARDAIYALEPDQVTADLDAAYSYIKNDPSSTGEVAVIGFAGEVPKPSAMLPIIRK